MKKVIKSIWNSFKTKPLKFGLGMLLASLSLYMFFGNIKFKASYDDVKVEIATDSK